MMDESWIDDLVDEPIDLQPRFGFETQLRVSLSEEWNGRTSLPTVDQRSRVRPRARWLAGAAVLVAILLGGLVMVRRESGGGTVVTPTPVDVGQVRSTAPSTVPDSSTRTTVTPTTVTPTTVPTSPMASSGTTPAAAAAPAGTSLLAGWPPPPRDDRNDLESVPRLLPTVPVGGADHAVRREGVGGPVTLHDYEQMWLGAVGDSIVSNSFLSITTNVGQAHSVPASQREVIEIPPWDEAFFVAGAPDRGVVSMWLSDPDGHVVLRAHDIDRGVVADVARSLRVRHDGAPGWDHKLSGSMIAVDEGWNNPSGSRTVRWFGPNDSLVAEMWITRGQPSTLTTGASLAEETEVTTIGDAPALATQTASRASVAWSPEPGITVLVGTVGTLDRGLQIARSIEPVDVATWDASSAPDTSDGDGCTSLFC